MENEILIGLIGVLSTCITQIAAQFLINKREIQVKKKENISRYLEPLNKQIVDNLTRLRYIKKRNEERGENNSIRLINGQVIRSIKDIEGKELKWYYEHGANLASTCYLLACLIAHSYHVKQHMTLVNFKESHRRKILGYIEKLQEILNRDYGIYSVIQYDIGQMMLCGNEHEGMISYSNFCKMVQHTETYCCFVQLFNFIINVANDERKEQYDDLLKLLDEFNAYIETIITVD